MPSLITMSPHHHRPPFLLLTLLLLLAAALLVVPDLVHAQASTSTQTTLGTTCAAGIPVAGITAGWTVRHFTLVISQAASSSSSSNSSASLLLVNGTSPGPRLNVSEFDVVQVTVVSLLPSSTLTAVHWHGLSQYSTPFSDGVAGVTQCGIGGGQNVTYTFCAYPAGDFLYRGLNDLQTVSGLYGGLIVQPAVPQPLVNASSNATAPTTVTGNATSTAVLQDLLLIAADVYDLNDTSLAPSGVLPQPVGLVVNGAASNASAAVYVNTSGVVTLRLMNAAGLSAFEFSVDGVTMIITTLDGSPVQPYPVSAVRLSVGQRAAVTLSFAAVANYSSVLYRVTRVGSPNATQVAAGQWVGVMYLNSLSGNDTAYPAYALGNATAPPVNAVAPVCGDINCLGARPTNFSAVDPSFFGLAADNSTIPIASFSLTLQIVQDGVTGAPLINDVTYNTSLLDSLPLSQTQLSPLYGQVLAVYSGDAVNVTASPILVASAPSQYSLPLNAVLSILLLNQDAVEHSFHMHGHHFWVVAVSDNPLAEYAYAGQYVVRDTVAIPASGWAQIRLVANNPGVWLLSSASDLYLSQGLAVVFLEDTNALTPTFTTLPGDQLALCNASIQAEMSVALAAWHSANDPVTYANSALSQTSRIIIGGVVGGVSAGVLIVILLCTLFGIHPNKDGGAPLNSPQQQPAAAAPTEPTSVSGAAPNQQSGIQLPTAPGMYAV